MYYLQSRYYDAGVGRFINADDCLEICCQIDFININLYSYCINNPLNGIDNDGYGIATIIAGAAIGGLLGAGLEVLLQLLQGRTFKTLDWWSISIEFLNGALTGGLIGAGLPACVTTQGRAMINAITSLFHSINKRDNFWVAVLKMIGSYLATLISGSYSMGRGKYVVADTMVKTIVNTIKTRFARFTIRVGFFSVTIVLDKIKSKG